MGDVRTAVIVDQWELVSLGISAVLAEHGYTTVATALHGKDGVRLARHHRPDLLVLGASAKGSVAEAAHHGARLKPRPQIVALVTAGDHAGLGQLIAEGVDALLVRSAAGQELGEAVERLGQGERYVAPALLSSLLDAPAPMPVAATTKLTPRERDVLAGLAQGLTNRQIASELFVGEETIKSHLSRLYAKLEASGRHDAVARAISSGLLG